MQQRLVHSQKFEFPEVQSTVEELSVDGGNIRIRTPIGKPCDWKGYKAVRLHDLQAIAASFQEQIDRRTKISGAQWKIENVPQVIAHRCAYLNGLIFAP